MKLTTSFLDRVDSARVVFLLYRRLGWSILAAARRAWRASR